MKSERVVVVKNVVFHRFMRLMQGELDADTINLFIKPEPHKLAKLAEGRLRLIAGISLIDSLIDKMIFGDLFDTALQSVGKTPALIGWNPYQGNYRIFSNEFPAGAVSVDKSAWDWSVPPWMIDLWLQFMLDMHSGWPEWYLNIIKIRFNLLFEEAVFETKTLRKKQAIKGIMKSGCFLTILLNSLGQSMLHYLCMLKMGLSPTLCQPWCLGDDTIQNGGFDLERYAELMRSYGFSPKIQAATRFVEFIGFLMDDERVVPAYWKKHLFLLKYLEEPNAVATLESYQMLYAFEPVMLDIIQFELRRRLSLIHI